MPFIKQPSELLRKDGDDRRIQICFYVLKFSTFSVLQREERKRNENNSKQIS